MNCICHIIFIQTHLKVTDMYSPTVIHLLMEKLLVKMFTSTSLTVPANMYISARLI